MSVTSAEARTTEASKPKEQSQFAIICKDRTILVNLVCMTIVWVAASFCYYLISFQLKYIQGDIWINSIVSSTSELFAFGLSGIIVGKLGLKWTIVISFIVANVGMICLAAIQPDNQTLLAMFIIGSKFGISANFNMAYVGN